jgi:hypothetical protein
MGAGMDDEVGDREPFAAADLVRERPDRALAKSLLRRGEVDEVGIVGRDEGQPARRPAFPEACHLPAHEPLPFPLAGALREDLQGSRADLEGALDPVRHAARDAHVGPDQGTFAGSRRQGDGPPPRLGPLGASPLPGYFHLSKAPCGPIARRTGVSPSRRYAWGA